MQTDPVASSRAPLTHHGRHLRQGQATSARPCRQARTRDEQFVDMLDAYRSTGGIANSAEISQLFRTRNGPDPATLQQWIDSRAVLCFEWNNARWMPWFQFNRHTLHPHPQLAQVMAEMAEVFDPWETATWFAQPSPWIHGGTPVDCLLSDLPGVLGAVRADRFVANG